MYPSIHNFTFLKKTTLDVSIVSFPLAEPFFSVGSYFFKAGN